MRGGVVCAARPGARPPPRRPAWPLRRARPARRPWAPRRWRAAALPRRTPRGARAMIWMARSEVAAQIGEPIVETDAARAHRRTSSQMACQHLLDRGARRGVARSLASVPAERGERPAVDLAVRRERERREQHDRRRHHVRREDTGQEGAAPRQQAAVGWTAPGRLRGASRRAHPLRCRATTSPLHVRVSGERRPRSRRAPRGTAIFTWWSTRPRNSKARRARGLT